MRETDEVFVEITTWQGISLGATHYYGYLRGYLHENDQHIHEIELKHPLTQREATKLNKNSGFDYIIFEKGDMYPGFDDIKEIVDLAIKTWKEYFPNACVLVLGKAVHAEPQEILIGPHDYMEKINVWTKLAPKGDWTKEWYKIADEFWEYRNNYQIEKE